MKAAKKSVMEKPALRWQTFNFLNENAFDQKGEKFQINLLNLLLTVGPPPLFIHTIKSSSTNSPVMWKFLSYLQKSGTMNLISFFVISTLFSRTLSREIQPSKRTNAHITVMGFVYCDICSNNTFSKYSYFIPGAEVQIDCKFKASSPRTKELITFSVNRTTNRHGVYRLDIPSVDGITCAEAAIASTCEARLMWSSLDSCNVPGYRTTTNLIAFKSKQANLCIYSLFPLNFRPSKIDTSLCGN
ncbi:hypothetical protein Patl1_03071 [Pistacia atlantica]|uniref:Uncharacterized protein n=1 Tax=Pistacia atlantica TaxID=434234 RepID=A0ACC1CB57_9ROSI|nr:hypothetical protein Patl1_03071 [Pistacia atlantica]